MYAMSETDGFSFPMTLRVFTKLIARGGYNEFNLYGKYGEES